VTGVHDAPVAANDAVTIGEDGTIVIDVASNDNDADGDAVTVSTVTQPANGAATLLATGADAGKVSYTPEANFAGTDTFTYAVADGHGGTATATVSVTVTNVNDAPAAANDTATTAEESAVVIDVRVNDSDSDGDTVNVTAVGTPANGTAAVASANPGSLTYTPKANFVGTDSFSYTISDGKGGVATATVTVTVTNVNDAPTTVDDAAALGEDSGTAVVDVVANDNSSPDLDETLTLTAVAQPAHGLALVVTEGPDAGKVSYTPHTNFFGSDSFTYTISDGNGGTATGRVAVTVTSINDVPTAVGDTASVTEDSDPNPIDVLSNDSSAPDLGETLSVTAVTTPANGTATLEAGTVTYAPKADFVGTDSFSYTLSDGNGGVAIGTATVTVTNINDAPTAGNDEATAAEDQVVLFNVRSNDADVDDDELNVESVTQPAHGVASVVASGTDAGKVSYTPATNFFGSDSFSYTISDGNGGTATATVAMSVASVNDMPTAVADTATVTEDSGATLIAVLSNDSSAPDVDETLSVAAVTPPAHGTATLVTTGADAGKVSYTPNANFSGADSFTYTLSDGNGGIALATVIVTVTNVNDAPTAADDAVAVAEDQAIILDVRSNDVDADGDALTVEGVSQPAHGVATLIVTGPAAGKVSYTPTANFFGSDTFTYTIGDGSNSTATATVNVSVTSANDAPSATSDTATTSEENAVVVDVRANDNDPDGDALSVTVLGTPANGTAAAGDAGIVTYTPRADFVGTDSFSYTVSDGHGGVATATVTITVTGVNDAPTAGNDAIIIAEDQAITLEVRSNDADIDEDPLSVDAVTQAAHGVVAVVTSGPDAGKVTYTPSADYVGSDSFTYTISDGHGGTAVGTVTVAVTGVNDAPAATNDTATTGMETAVVLDVRSNDTDPDADPMIVISVGAPANGTAELLTSGAGAGLVSYTPNAGFIGADSFTYAITDGNGGTATATVLVSVSQ
jgi:large repetitive protein